MDNSNLTKVFFKLNHSDNFYYSFEDCLKRGIDLNFKCREDKKKKKSSYEIVIEAVELTMITDFQYTFSFDKVFQEIDNILRRKGVFIEGNFAISNHYNGYLNKGFLAPMYSLVENAVSEKEEMELQKLLDSIIAKYTKTNLWSSNNVIKGSITITKQEEDDFQRNNVLSERITNWLTQMTIN